MIIWYNAGNGRLSIIKHLKNTHLKILRVWGHEAHLIYPSKPSDQLTELTQNTVLSCLKKTFLENAYCWQKLRKLKFLLNWSLYKNLKLYKEWWSNQKLTE